MRPRQKLYNDLEDFNLKKFMRKHREYYDYQLVYSKLIPKIKKIKGGSRVIRKLKKAANKNIKHISEIINITFTLNKYFNKPLSVRTIQMAININRIYWDDIYDYMKVQRQKGVILGKVNQLNAKKALAEQKARGFIHVNDFEDYNKEAAHIYSNVDRDLIYPENFSHGIFYRYKYPISIYIGQYIYGVQGYTSTKIPLSSNQQKGRE